MLNNIILLSRRDNICSVTCTLDIINTYEIDVNFLCIVTCKDHQWCEGDAWIQDDIQHLVQSRL